MSKLAVGFTPLVSMLCLSYCAHQAIEIPPDEIVIVGGGGTPECRVAEASASLARRYVALMPDGHCPEVEGWATENLVPKDGPAPLRGFCAYTWEDSETLPSCGPQIQGKRPLAGPDPDPDDLVVLGEPGLLDAAREDRFLYELGVNELDAMASEVQPHVAIIDASEHSSHGQAMRAIVRRVACPSGADCTFFVPALHGNPDHPSIVGGRFTLARAIAQAVRGHSGSPLILNMSLGWSTQDTSTLSAAMDAFWQHRRQPKDWAEATELEGIGHAGGIQVGTAAVHAALEWASCTGALPIAATGNSRGGACSEEGAMAPAAWEALAAPTQEQCAQRFGIKRAPLGSPYAPLVYGAGGVGRSDAPLGSVRANSLPPRVLYSSMVSVGTDASGSSYTGPWTGTSVAAAALSGIVARKWGHAKSKLDAHAIMALIDSQAHPTGLESASVCLHVEDGKPCPPIRRVRANDGPKKGIVAPAWSVDSSPLIQEIRSQTPVKAALATVSLASKSTSTSTCYGLSLTRSSSPTPTPVPSSRAISPQPEVAICATCPITSDSTEGYDLTIKIDGAYDGYAIDAPALLQIHDGPNVQEVRLDLTGCKLNSSPRPSCLLSLDGLQLADGRTLVTYLRDHRESIDSGRLLLWASPFSSSPSLSSYQVFGSDIEIWD